jgi:hypothetical protein
MQHTLIALPDGGSVSVPRCISLATAGRILALLGYRLSHRRGKLIGVAI